MTKTALLHKLLFAWYRFRAKVEYGPVWNVKNFLYFMSLALRFLFGRLTLVTMDEVTAKGGYKYLALYISKRPLSKTHLYEELK